MRGKSERFLPLPAPARPGTDPVARMAFEFTADHEGRLTFDMAANLRILGEQCPSGPSQTHHFALSWARVNADGKLTRLGGYSAPVNHFEFRNGNKYNLVYEILDFSTAYAGCAAATIRFAIHESPGEHR